MYGYSERRILESGSEIIDKEIMRLYFLLVIRWGEEG